MSFARLGRKKVGTEFLFSKLKKSEKLLKSKEMAEGEIRFEIFAMLLFFLFRRGFRLRERKTVEQWNKNMLKNTENFLEYKRTLVEDSLVISAVIS